MKMKFTTTSKTVPIQLENKQGAIAEYELRQTDAATRDKYMDSLMPRMRMDKDGKPAGVSRFDGMQADLLTHTLWNKDGLAVRKDVIQSWPASTVSALFQEAQKLNLLNSAVEEVLEEAKKA